MPSLPRKSPVPHALLWKWSHVKLLPSCASLLILTILLANETVARETFLLTPSFSPPHPSVVRVAAMERDGVSYGSGALVAVSGNFGLVLSNWHVVRDTTGPVAVFFPDGFRSPATVLRVDREWDLAALVIWRPAAPPIPIADRIPLPGEWLTIAGYGSGSYRALSGVCTQYLSPGGNLPYELIELNAPAREGDSGGPILNARGELAGVLFGSAFGRTTGSHCGRVRHFLYAVEGDFQALAAQSLSRPSPQRPSKAPFLAAVPRQATAAAPETPKSPVDLLPCVIPAGQPEQEAERKTAAPQIQATPPPDDLLSLPSPPSTDDRIKTALAAIGVVAILYQFLRLLGRLIG